MTVNKKDEVLADIKGLTQIDIDYCVDLPTDLASNISYQSANTGALMEMLDYWNDSDVDLVIDEHAQMIKKGELPDMQTRALIGEVLLLELVRYSIENRKENRPKNPEPATPLDIKDGELANEADRINDEIKNEEL